MTATDFALTEESPRQSSRRRTAPALVRSKPKAMAKPDRKPAKSATAIAQTTAKPATASPQVWTAQFVFAGADGSSRISLMMMTADSAEAARAIAVAHAPAEEFMVSVLPRSEEQFLGQVRFKALAAAGKTT